MKKLFYLMTAVLLLWGCENDTQEQVLPTDKEVEENIIVQIGEIPETLYASMDSEQDEAESRTYLEDKRVLWQNGDAISYFSFNTHNTKYIYTGEDGLSNVELNRDESVSGTLGNVLLKSQAVYPYSEDITVEYDEPAGIDKIYLSYPTTMKYGVNSFGREANIMVAAGVDNGDTDLYFRNVCGYLVIKLYGTGTNGLPTSVKSITLSSVSGVDKIAGAAEIIASADKAPIIAMASNAATAVTMDCSNDGAGVALGADAEHATEFWFCLPPVTFNNGIKITVTDVYDKSYTKQTANTVNIVRNEVQPMAALEFESNAPAATRLWYTRSDGEQTPLEFYDDMENPFNAPITKHGWDPSIGKIVIEFGAPLTTIQEEAFRDTKIATIVMPEGITTIEEGAFENSHLREITFPGSMTDIEVNAFYNCGHLESVTFLPSPTKTPLNICNMDWAYVYGPFYDSKLTTINLNRELNYVDEDGDSFTADDDDEGIFYHKNYSNVGEVNVTLGPQVENIWYKMFNHLPIKTLTIPGTVKTIENNVFEGCSALTTLNFEPSVDGSPLTIGYYGGSSDDSGPFYDSPLTTVNLNREIVYTFGGSTINDKYEGLFGGKSSLTSVTLGEQVKTLSPYMFASSGFTTLDLNKVETIGNHALTNTPLTSLTVPGCVNTIGNNVFEDCEQLVDLTFEPSTNETPLTMGFYDASGDVGPFYDAPLATLDLNREIVYTFGGSTIDDKSEGLFGNKSTLTKVTLGEQVKTLSSHMFANAAFTELVVPGSLTLIENDVFLNCRSLHSITFKPSPTNEVLTMGYDTYDADENLFQDNDALTTLVLDREINQAMTGIDSDVEGLFGGMPKLTNVTLGEQVTTLTPYMFAGSGITSIDLNKVKTINNSALARNAITSLTIPGYVNTIGNNVFQGCSQLATLTFEPSADETPLTMGFYDASDDDGPFYDSPLATLNLNREIIYTFGGYDISSDNEGLFGGKKSLTNVTLGDQVKTLSKRMFAGAGFTSINLNKVETINDYALTKTAITALTIPGYATTIGNNVFEGCTSLTSLKFGPSPSDTPLTIGYYVGSSDDDGPFYDSPLTTVDLNRELVYTFDNPNEADEGLFGDKSTLINLTLGEQAKTISPFMFANAGIQKNTGSSGSNVINLHQYILKLNYAETIGKNAFMNTGITTLRVYPSVAMIDDNAFMGCASLEEVAIESSNQPITFGFQPGSNQHGPFYQSPLTNIVVHRNLKMTDAYESACDEDDEGIFSNSYHSDDEPITVILGGQISELPKYVFAGLDIESISIPQVVNKINGWAFYNCKKLSTVRFESGTTPLTIGAQIGSSDSGPFWQSPLSNIYINRELVMDEEYAEYCDQSDEGVFSNEYYDDDELPVTNLIIGNNMKTILPYMFASTRIQQLHLPESVDVIGKNVIENNEVINAIIFYDNKVRPEIADGAFGKSGSSLIGGNTYPGNFQYFVFVPYKRGTLGSAYGELYFTTDDLMADTYWDEIHGIMVDVPGNDQYGSPLNWDGRGYESRYLDVEGYEWYRKRYYNRETITPPAFQ